MDEVELSRLRALLEQTQQTLDLVMRQVPAIYWRIDRDRRVVESGGSRQEVVGYEDSRYIGKTLAEQQRMDPTSVDSIALHERALGGEVVSFDTEFRGRMLAVTVTPQRDGNGEVAGAIGTATDVTRARLLERRMVDAQRAESLGVLAGGLAHDFNNMLVAVLGNADLALREIPAGSPGRVAIESIRLAGLRAAEMIDQLLKYAGKGGAGTTRVEPALLVDELLRILMPSIPPDVRITIDMPARFAIRADPAQVRQVLLNLVNNARDALAGRGGEITIQAEAMHVGNDLDPDDILTAPAGSYIAIRVADDGPGMDAATRMRMFEPFFTTKSSSGIGLAAVLGIVRAHGGGIRVISKPGAGAEVVILWPAAVTAPIRAPSGPERSLRTVLVIDDEALVRDVVARMVEDLGYAALTAADGPTGLAQVEDGLVDAVIVDMTMPLMSGADVVAAVRAKRPKLPVIIYSGYDRDGRGPVQADAFLPKPFRIDALERTLAKLLPLQSV